MANLKDIAERAGVNIATVSRFFNNRSLVKAATAARIEEIVKEVGYRQRARRQGPRTPDRVGIRYFRVMIVMSAISSIEHFFRWGTISCFISSVFEELQKLDFSVELCVVGEDGAIPDRLNPDYCDGVIICSEPDNPSIRKKLYDRLQGIATVNTFLACHDGNSQFDLVRFDSVEIARISARHFFDRGAKEVAVFPDHKHLYHTRELTDTFRGECERSGMKMFDLSSVVHDNDLQLSDYYRKLAQAFQKHKNATALLFTTSADMLGVMNELRAAGVNISKYEFIAVFSSPHTLRYFEKMPPFIDIKLAQLGTMTAKRLLDRIHSFNKLPRTDIVIAPELTFIDKA